ncbi:MAG: SMC-Scp complex subunit ScpB, partial [Lachnospiraceae bacterium]|nr:SMC-Scp complex subunit ScpB [Lachnospiraceae bacterium]
MFENEIKTALDGDESYEPSKSDILKNIDTSMYSSDELREQEQIVEAILFMMGDSVTVDTLATALSKDHDIALAAVERLIQKYETDYKDRGMKVIRINHKYQMVANNKYFQNLVLVASKPQKPVLTDAVLETLSIIAYKQPITKPEIEDIRGVKSDFAVNRLIEYGLVEEKGRLEAPGRPIILGTTEEFLLRFGLESTDDLPILPPTREAEIQTEVEKELTETLGEPVHVDKEDIDAKEENDADKDINENAEEKNDDVDANDADTKDDGNKEDVENE